MLDRIHDLYDELERQKVMLSFKGSLTEDLITALLGLVELKMIAIEPDARARKRVFNVVTECLQNLFHHNAHLKLAEGHTVPTADPHGVVMIAHADSGYSVLTGNFMAAGDVGRLKSHLDRINTLGPDQLRELYRGTLADGQFSPHGGGGLGMIDIARKSGGKLEYGFVPYDKDNAFFSLNVNVTP
ncbi:MAG: SiaB family protein kinase [Flavobacteriales bacterium]